MGNKPEVFLEIGAGFFRIPTSEINYNITVVDSGEPGNRPAPAAPVAQGSQENVSQAQGGDDFYEIISNDLYNDIGELAKSLSTTIIDIPAEDRKLERATLDEAGDKIEGAKAQLRDIVEMTEKAAMDIMDSVESVQKESGNVKALLDELKSHTAFNHEKSSQVLEEGEGDVEEESLVTKEVSSILTQVDTILGLVNDLGAREAEAPPVATAKEVKSRYLFDLDVIFQTLYELCTNETVKDHITDARGRASELFELDKFHDKISEKAVNYEADGDNYFDVPMSDVFQSLFAVCSDKGIKNLLKKMDAGQSTIFLDQAIPVEVPEIEEIEVAGEAESGEAIERPAPAAGIAEIITALDGVKAGLSKIPEIAATSQSSADACSTMTVADQREIFEKIEAAFDVSASISVDVSRITEVLSFQDLSGQQILKIIKLLSDFQVQLLAIVVSFGSQLKHKTENASISVEESRKFAQDDVDRYIVGVPDADDGGMLDQDTVNDMLAEFGFD